MTLRLKTFAAALAVLALAGCAANTLQRAGASTVFDLRLDSTLDWARIKGARQETWTIDGTRLNQLRIYSNIKPGEHVFMARKEKASKPDGPWFRSGMRPDELRDLVLDGLREEGAVNLDSGELHPHRFGAVDGLRFDFAMSNADGLNYKGTVAAVEREGKLTSLVWMAPSEHYYSRDAAAVGRMLDTMQFVR
ncbi:hypothetical protein RDV84_14175 [Lysobacter yananisis]|uniref:Lipoprotein n=2 Tax=Lysobacter TaxID=68 RepID=A0A0S2DKE8_LYSEN|nr:MULTISPECIES: hypothetical protein [Lysobacter]ALN59094.1 lipoprotein [Lysobacter enzymogenes]QCW27326.1 hypothetical protein FE772_18460 [Lysobacter enzymogenes]UZW62134.1 hypothetical protein BV903_007560 [Lysobacter enzymogenes]WMT01145.1 hypothetical protein RDV84_14175 [Lysobacter yananisis]